jgi:DNA mismatch repair protein MutL
MVLNEIKNAIYSALHSKSIMKEVKGETLLHDSKDINNLRIFDRSSGISVILGGLENKFTEETEETENIRITEVEISNKDIAVMESLKPYDKFEFKQQKFIKAENDEDKLPELFVIGIVMDTYIICENPEKTCMFMIDQHAAHERINYEKFLNQYNSREILIQEIVPEVINLSYDDYETAMSNIEIFEYLGISVENFGNNAILINNIPTIFKDSNLKDVFYAILDNLKDITKSNLDFVMEKIIKEACVKSVKSGDRLHMSEVRALLNDLRMTDNPYTCPHGRPVIIKMTRYEIEKMFERIQS